MQRTTARDMIKLIIKFNENILESVNQLIQIEGTY